MGNPPGFWVYLLANFGFIAAGGLMTGLSLLAYWHSPGQRSYGIATFGFGCVVLGGLAELLYTLRFEHDFLLSSTEFLYLQAGEDVLIAGGLGLVFYAITQYDTESTKERDLQSSVEGDSWVTRKPHDK